MLKYFNQKLKGIKGVLPDIRGFSRTSDDGQLQSVIGIDNMLIYGNSIQDGTPSPDNPVEIQSVGDKTVNLFDESYLVDLGFVKEEDGRYYEYNTKGYDLWINTDGIQGSFKVSALIEGEPGDDVGLNFYTLYTDGTRMWNNGVTNPNKTVERVCFSSPRLRKTWVSKVLITQDITADYEPYGKYKIPIIAGEKTTNIYLDEPLRRIGESVDYIDWKNGKVVRNVKYIVFKGTEDIDLPSTSVTGFSAFRYSGIYSYGKPFYMCEDLEFVNKNFTYANRESIMLYGSVARMFFVISDDRITHNDVTAFKNWLEAKYNTGNPLIVYYQAVSPKEESIDLPDLKSIIPQYDRDYTLSVGTAVTPQLSIKYRSNYQEEV